MGIFDKFFKPKPAPNAEEIIKEIDYKEGTLFAKNDTNKVYIDIEELGGFPYLKTVLIGDTKANIKKNGCTISFVLNNEEITLASDNTTVESNEINKSGVFYTPVDFELDESDAKKIVANNVTEVKYTLKNTVYAFKTV
ncbi:hypothetical protein SAMN05444411_104168 [Lutibacter oricola]|uniref:Uncharacterized protein n=1 Tax=Lutibacter oricola TaxID=762486 RepID=A0A1H3AML4_9FLAO|nr:hypothetical protein [Lutibacter oricola]SDX30628.1 hypothetical protein SAMN05444411_104168 [Lutibacter oricola]